MEIVVYKNGDWRPVDNSWEYRADPDFLVAIKVEGLEKIKAELEAKENKT